MPSVRIPVTDDQLKRLHQKSDQEAVPIAQAGRSLFDLWIDGEVAIQKAQAKAVIALQPTGTEGR